MWSKIKKGVTLLGLTALLMGGIITEVDASAKDQKKETDIGSVIIHHVMDSYKWHFATWGDQHYTLHLPIIIYSPSKGFDVFSSSHLGHGHDSYKGYTVKNGSITAVKEGVTVYDFSITKNVAAMLLSMTLLFLLFIPVARAYKKRQYKAPKGLQSIMEPIILFIRDDVARPMLGNIYKSYMPFLLTVFFFILINNLLGLIPGSANVTGNFSVTLTLAAFTFLLTNLTTNKHYWKHIFNTPGVPWWLKFGVPIMPIVETATIITKPAALCIRLFANMLSGHLIILSLVSLIFIFSSIDPTAGIGVSIVSVLFTLFMYLIKILVAVIQAYIFTILSALFIGEAKAEHH